MNGRVGSDRVTTRIVGPAFVVYWHASPDSESILSAVEELEAARAAAGALLTCCAYVPDGVPPPSTDARQLILQLTPRMLESCAAIHTVQVGASIAAVSFRAVGRSMVVAGGYRKRIFIHNSLETFLNSAAPPGLSSTALRNAIHDMCRGGCAPR